MTGDPILPGEDTENESCWQSPIAPPKILLNTFNHVILIL